jgi:hypothetical protein
MTIEPTKIIGVQKLIGSTIVVAEAFDTNLVDFLAIGPLPLSRPTSQCAEVTTVQARSTRSGLLQVPDRSFSETGSSLNDRFPPILALAGGISGLRLSAGSSRHEFPPAADAHTADVAIAI